MTASKEVTLEREKRAWELRLKFWSETDIAADLGISQSAVSQMLKRVHARMRKEFQEGANQVFELQFNQLMIMAKEAIEAWHQSRLETRPARTPAPKPQPERNPAPPAGEPTEPFADRSAEEAPSLPATAGEDASIAAEVASPPVLGPGKPTYLRLTMQAMAAMRTLVEHGLVPALRLVQLKDRFLSLEQTQPKPEMKIPEGHRINELGFVVPRIELDDYGDLINMMTGRPATEEEAGLYGI